MPGMKKWMLASALGLLLAGSAAWGGPIRVACIGDSITLGAGAPKGQDYPAQLQKLLGPQYEVRNFGNSGSTLLRNGDKPYAKQVEFQAALDFRPDIAVVMLGTNDSKPQNWDVHGDFADDYQWLVEQLRRANPPARIFACRPTPVLVPGRYGIDEETLEKEFPIIDQVVTNLRLQFIDMHAALAAHPEDFPDHVHPNGEGAALMAKAAAAAILKSAQ